MAYHLYADDQFYTEIFVTAQFALVGMGVLESANVATVTRQSALLLHIN